MDEGKMNASRRVLSITALKSGFGVLRCEGVRRGARSAQRLQVAGASIPPR